MATVEEIEAAVAKLSPAKLAQFQAWFEEFVADAWDRQIENDVRAGRLDWLVEEGLREHQAGTTSEL